MTIFCNQYESHESPVLSSVQCPVLSVQVLIHNNNNTIRLVMPRHLNYWFPTQEVPAIVPTKSDYNNHHRSGQHWKKYNSQTANSDRLIKRELSRGWLLKLFWLGVNIKDCVWQQWGWWGHNGGKVSHVYFTPLHHHRQLCPHHIFTSHQRTAGNQHITSLSSQ